ncbi:MAG: hypothetical protein J6S23_05765 [Clostridia bacterium]|nr:hypothetical protein [Clostridia bacterium]
MKKIISIILALSMISILGICVFAADNSVTVEYEVAADYTVVIPESITMTNGSATQTISVTAGSLIYADETLEITISDSANYADGFRMVNSKKSDVYLGYTIKAGDTNVALGDTVLTASAEEVFAGKEATIVITAGTPTAAGTYSDILTFSIGTRK